jgi:hypothetical protein
MAFLTKTEVEQIQFLKTEGILRLIRKGELKGLTSNGGVAFFCGDGDIDTQLFHRQHISHRPHAIGLFGGPQLLAPSFRGHDTPFVEGLLRNISWGRGAKKTQTAFLYPHWPCGVGSALFGYTMIEWINLMNEVTEVLKRHSKDMHSFFHVAKKTDEGIEEQNTYLLKLPSRGIRL